MKKVLIFFIVVFCFNHSPTSAQGLPVTAPPEIWSIRSVDTMKTSRDKARAELYNKSYDNVIDNDLKIIKEMGANYVAIDTPYDDEFLPYLKRWVAHARSFGLKVWYRGNWSNWEGWFDYPKNMSPTEHIAKTSEFVEKHSDIFEDGDIFDPCPECENAGFWQLNSNNAAYNQFLQDQQAGLKKSFNKINKQVYTNIFSIIGGRAREVLDKQTANNLDNTITIDHYFKNTSSLADYYNHFSKDLNSHIIFGEFGAPIPDINGNMDENKQAEFIYDAFSNFYENKDVVIGINYNVLAEGSSALVNYDRTPRKAIEVIKDFYIPGSVQGVVTNTLCEKVPNLYIGTKEIPELAITNSDGEYRVVAPAGNIQISTDGTYYKNLTRDITITRGSTLALNIVVEPENPTIIYKLRLWLNQVLLEIRVKLKKFNL